MDDESFSSLQGQLLIAAPSLVDTNFWRTVVLVAEHSDEGAMGLVLNRPLDVLVAEAVEALAMLVASDEPVFQGGPVAPEEVVALAEFADPELAAEFTFTEIAFIGADPDIEELAGAISRARVFAGYAGWGAGQLEAELSEQAWIIEPALPDDVFAEEPESLWSQTLRRRGGVASLIALMPPDPSMN
ncbi:MAG: YqgE/AlgH family protein [Actinomycetia bacterium]|nr:YqgE/AlgH family protein [Actinomycetes bacterium]